MAKIALYCERDKLTFIAPAGALCPICRGEAVEAVAPKAPYPTQQQMAAAQPATEEQAVAAAMQEWEKDHHATA